MTTSVSHLVNSLIMQQGSSVLSADLTKGNIDTPQAKTARGVRELDGQRRLHGRQTDLRRSRASRSSTATSPCCSTEPGSSTSTTRPPKFKYEADQLPDPVRASPQCGQTPTPGPSRYTPNADPVKYRAALEFINYLYQHDQDWALGTGHISCRTSVLNSASVRGSAAAQELRLYRPHRGAPRAAHRQLARHPEDPRAIGRSQLVPGKSVDKALKDGNNNITTALKQ